MSEEVKLPPDEERTCPWVNGPCIKEQCLRYYPTQVMKPNKLGMAVPKTVYMCLDMVLVGMLQSLMNLKMSEIAAQQQRGGLGGLQIPPGFMPQG